MLLAECGDDTEDLDPEDLLFHIRKLILLLADWEDDPHDRGDFSLLFRRDNKGSIMVSRSWGELR